MTITTTVPPSARKWAAQKAAELAKKPLDELTRGFEEAMGYDKAEAIGIILSCTAPMTDDELNDYDYVAWKYIIMLEEV